jgi:hypothetical protein|tara:strand:- start:1663 stop:2499 length:837 start_codon:yes stop_codon:yes gene_type:complete
MDLENIKAYEILRNEEYEKYTEKKGNFDYLSWAVAWDKVKKNFQEVTYKTHEYKTIINGNELTLPYMIAPNQTAMVKVDIAIVDNNNEEMTTTMELAVRDNRMQAVVDPPMTLVENTIRRCLAKGISTLTGFGIELWFGEDIKGLDHNDRLPTHLCGSKIVIGQTTQKQSLELDRLMRDPNCIVSDQDRIKKVKLSAWNITEAEAQILIADVKQGIVNNKKPTRTALNKIEKMLDSLDIDTEKKTKHKKWLSSGITNKQLEAFKVKLENFKPKETASN